MENFHIYLAGGMEGLEWSKQIKWRMSIEKELEKFDYRYKPIICSPPNYFNFENPTHDNEREVMEFDLNKVRNSDLVIVNFTHKPISLGTMAEISIAYDRQIPVLGICEDDNIILHPWQKEMCLRIFSNMEDLTDYVIHYYLN